MNTRKFLNIMVSLTVLTTLVFGGSIKATAMPMDPTDETKVPHYFGPNPNWALSPLRLPNVFVDIAAPTTAGGTTATATASVDPVSGAITGYTITNPGSGYTSNPDVSITGLGKDALASAVVDYSGVVTAITVDPGGGGGGYTAPTVTISGGGATTDATATAYGGVDAATLDPLVAYGGYTKPVVEFGLSPDGVPATATGHATCVEDPNCTPVGGGFVTVNGIVVDTPGSGYSAAPTVIIRDGAVNAPVSLLLNYATSTLTIQKVVLNTFGSGYTSAPDVAINPTNLGATATATITTSGGSVIAINKDNPGSGYMTPGIKKFVDGLPGLCYPGMAVGNIPACPTTGKYIPLAVAEKIKYPLGDPNGIEADQYVIGLVQYRTSFHSTLPKTLVRGYVQLKPCTGATSDIHLANELMGGGTIDTGYCGVTPPQYLGPIIVASKNKPVRIVFRNLLPTDFDGDLFLPVDSTLMGSGMGPMGMAEPVDQGSVMDGVRNPMCSQDPKPMDCFKDNRATLHLHGGISPWISDGTAHQWITPAGEMTNWPQGVTVSPVPDMNVCTPDNPATPNVDESAIDGCMTFYYTNQQSARLLFYHDHLWGETRLQVYAGAAAGYLITDETEQALFGPNGPYADLGEGIPLIIQDKTFVPEDWQLYNQYDGNGNVTSYGQDPTWDQSRWGSYGDLWYHHVYMPAQNPGDPSGMSAYGRWMYGPWFWPPATPPHGPIPNPYYNMDPKGDPNAVPPILPFSRPLAVPCNLDDPTTWQYTTDPFCEPQLIPGTPNISVGMEQFNDTPIVNGVAYPTVTLPPQAFRLRILSAANDRFLNLQWYVADQRTGTDSEVALNAAEVAAAQLDPVVFPTPDLTWSPAGPDWIQIGTEGGFLPAPVVVDGQQPTTWITDPTRFDVGNVDLHSLLLAPAERADVIVDFSQFAGKTLILYNDAPAAFPARVPSYDYYTGAPDLSPNGAPGIPPGYGPNTRTIMQVKICDPVTDLTCPAPTPAFDLNRLPALAAAFAHQTDGSGVFESGQHPIIVGQAAYNSAYGTNFAAGSNCNAPGSTLQTCDGFLRVNDHTIFGFNTLLGQATKMTMRVEPKAIHDEMNSTAFDEFGRMTANLGVEVQPPTPGVQNVVLYPFVNPPTELIDATNLPKVAVTYDATTGLPKSDVKVTPISDAADGTQIWRITHNGVDTHPIHFHLYDVQIVNRVTWDNIIIPTDPAELGWKDTVRISPLQDTIVALRPIIPEVPFELPNAIRPLNPMMPLGSTAMFNNVDVQGNPTAPIINQLVNFGWEYTYHCHILSHEEMDMMRPVAVALPPNKPVMLPYSITGSGGNAQVNLAWDDNSINETEFVIQRLSWPVTSPETWTDVGIVYSPLSQPNTHGTRTFVVPGIYDPNAAYKYRIVARNTIGYGSGFPSMTVKSNSDTLTLGTAPLPPSNLTAVFQTGPQIRLTWKDNAINEAGFIIERSTDNVNFSLLTTVGPRTSTGNVTFTDTTVKVGTTAPITYYYRVAAANVASTLPYVYSNTASATVPLVVPPAAPTSLVPTLLAGPQIKLTWMDNAVNETDFLIERKANGGAFSQIATVPAFTGTGTVTYTDTTVTTSPADVTYTYRVTARNTGGTASITASILVPALPATPSSLFAVNGPNANKKRTVILTWIDNSTNETGFTIQRATNALFTQGLTTITVGANVSTLTQSGLNPNTQYWFRIRANNGTVITTVWVNATPFPIKTNP